MAGVDCGGLGKSFVTLLSVCETLWAAGAVDCVETESIEVSKPRDVVGVIGLVAWLDDEVGEARSFC